MSRNTFDLLFEASEIAHAASWAGLNTALDARHAAVAGLRRLDDERPDDRAAWGDALRAAEAAKEEVRSWWGFHFGTAMPPTGR